jgi:XPB/Ssl2-like helicase family protein
MSRRPSRALGPVQLREALETQHNADQLRKIAQLFGPRPPTRKSDLVGTIAEHLEGEALRRTWERLGKLQKLALAEATHNLGGRLDLQAFQAKHGPVNPWEEGLGDKELERFRRSYWDRPVTLLDAFFHGGVVPPDLSEALARFVPRPAAPQLETLGELPQRYEIVFERYDYHEGRNETVREDGGPLQVRETERAAQHDLHAVLRLVQAGHVSVGPKTGMPSAASMRQIESVLLGGDFYPTPAEPPKKAWDPDPEPGPIRAFAWPLLLQAGRLVETSGSKLSLTRAGIKALSDEPPQVLRSLWQRWEHSTLLDELRRVDEIKGQTGKASRSFTPLAGRRQVIAAALAECPPGRWVATSELFRYMQAAGHDFAVVRDEGWRLYLVDPNYGNLAQNGGVEDWRILRARYALALLFEFAATLGLVDVAYVRPAGSRPDYGRMWGSDDMPFLSRYDGLAYLRLTPLGAWILGAAERYVPAKPERRPVLKVLPNRDVVADSAAIPPSDALFLDAYAEKASDVVWRLSRAALLAAAEAGRPLGELHEFLQTRSSVGLPETVRQLLQDVEARAGRLQDRGAARLVECDSPELAVLLASDVAVGKCCLRAGERHLVVPAASEKLFRSALRRLGYVLPSGPGVLAALEAPEAREAPAAARKRGPKRRLPQT